MRLTTTAQVLPILEEIRKVGDDVWWRVALFPKRQQASHARTAVIKALAEAAVEWEFKATKTDAGGSALYARRVGGR